MKKKLIINKFSWVKHFREKKELIKKKMMKMMIDYVNDKSEKINDNNSKENHF